MVSLLALVLAIGIVVDDAIVVVEAVEANLEDDPRLSPAEAAKRAMAEITAPIIAITLVLLSVFVPVAFIPGICGQLYQQFAVAVSVSMVISAINALTLSPALCAILLKPAHGPKRGPMRYVMAGIDKARDGYAAVVKLLVRRAVIEPRRAGRRHLRSTWRLFKATPTGFLPSEDQGAFFVEAQLPEGASVNRTRAWPSGSSRSCSRHRGHRGHQHGRRLQHAGRAGKSNSGYFIVLLKPFEERTDPALGRGLDHRQPARPGARRSARPT